MYHNARYKKNTPHNLSLGSQMVASTGGAQGNAWFESRLSHHQPNRSSVLFLSHPEKFRDAPFKLNHDLSHFSVHYEPIGAWVGVVVRALRY